LKINRPYDDPISLRIREQLRRLRQARGWSIYDLSRAAEVSPSFISMIENGHKAPDPGTIERLARALGMDEELMRAWMTLRDRSAEPMETIEAASAMRSLVTDDAVLSEEPALYARAPLQSSALRSLPSERGRTAAVPVPLVAEGGTLERDGAADEEPLLVDRRLLPTRTDLTGMFAWRLTRDGVARVRGEYRRGDYVLIAPQAWEPEPGRLAPPRVFAVRIGGRVVLSRVTWGGGQLILLPAEGATDYVVQPVTDTAALRKRIVARVVAAVRRFPERGG
jgi:transcriptional regulator with XRE-family HTH domain